MPVQGQWSTVARKLWALGWAIVWAEILPGTIYLHSRIMVHKDGAHHQNADLVNLEVAEDGLHTLTTVEASL